VERGRAGKNKIELIKVDRERWRGGRGGTQIDEKNTFEQWACGVIADVLLACGQQSSEKVPAPLDLLRGAEKNRKLKVVPSGDAAIWFVFAPQSRIHPVSLKLDLGSFRGDDQDSGERIFVPGIQRAGGLKATLLLAHFPSGNSRAGQLRQALAISADQGAAR